MYLFNELKHIDGHLSSAKSFEFTAIICCIFEAANKLPLNRNQHWYIWSSPKYRASSVGGQQPEQSSGVGQGDQIGDLFQIFSFFFFPENLTR